MIDNEFERKGREMSDKLNQIVDLEYTWGDFPALTAEQIYKAYDARAVCAQVTTCNGAVVMALQSERDQLRAELEQANKRAKAERDELKNKRINDRCPACGHDTLFVSDAGYLTCSWLTCPEPGLLRYVAQVQNNLDDAILKREAAIKQAQIANAGRAQAEAERDAARRHMLQIGSNVFGLVEKLVDAEDERDAAIADARRLLELFRRQSIRSFVAGAAWWEFHETKAIMWASDRDKAWTQAAARFPFVHVDHREDDDIVSEYTAMVEKYGGAK